MSSIDPATTDPTRRLAPVVRLAPAKLNLTLAVVGRRPDGYHALHSVMVPLGLSDRLSLAVAATGGGDSLHVDRLRPGPARRQPGPPRDRRDAGRRSPAPVSTRRRSRPASRRRIPVAAGLAGGSSDAAAAIDAALEAWGAAGSWATRSGSRWPRASAATCRSSSPAAPPLVEGRGERLTRLHGVTAHHGQPTHAGVLLVTPPVPAHTAAVFAAWAGGAMGDPGVVAADARSTSRASSAPG